MYSSAAETANKISIPSVYVTMKDGEALKDAGEVDVEVRFKSSVSPGGSSVYRSGVFVPIPMPMRCFRKRRTPRQRDYFWLAVCSHSSSASYELPPPRGRSAGA